MPTIYGFRESLKHSSVSSADIPTFGPSILRRSTLMTGYFPAQHGVKYTLELNMHRPKKNPQVELPTGLPNIAKASLQ